MAVIKIVPMPGAVGDKGDEGAVGPQGPQGPAGQNGLPGTPALWSYQGAYNSSAAYAVGDVVVYQGQLYYTKSVTTAGTLPTVTAKFDLIASKGADGTNGTNGTNGVDGKDSLFLGTWNSVTEFLASHQGGPVGLADGDWWAFVKDNTNPNKIYVVREDPISATGWVIDDNEHFVLPQGPQGEPGEQGEPGNQGEPGAAFGIYYLGNYNPNSGYLPNIAVVRGSDGQLYLAKASGQLGDPVGNTAQWEVWIPKGQDGAPGTNGADALWNYVGEYGGGNSYAVGDVVTYDGQLWYRYNSNGGNVGDTPSPGLWNLLAAKGSDGTELNFWNFAGDPGVPTVDGALVTDGLSARSGGNVTIHATTGGKVVVAGDGGEFLFDSNVPANQIATIGDIEEIHTLSNGLVVNGYIDDEGINPAGTMSLNVGPGYSAIMDLSAHSATFNGDVQITNLSGARVTTIETPTTINNDLTVTGNVSMPSLITSGTWGHDFFEESGLTTETYDTVADFYKIGELVYFDLNVNLGYVTDWGQTQVDPPLWHSWSFKLPYNARGIYATSNPVFTGTIYDTSLAEEVSERTSNDQGHNPIFGKIVNAGGQSYVYLYSIVNTEVAGWAPGEFKNITSVFPKDFTQPANLQTGLGASRLRISGTYRSV